MFKKKLEQKLSYAIAKPSGECGENEWRCDNGKCINEDFLCDGTTDCTDSSDEGSVCESTQGPQHPPGKV